MPGKHDVPTVACGPLGLRELMVVGGDKAVTSGLLRNGPQDRVEREKRIAGNVHPPELACPSSTNWSSTGLPSLLST